jgi:hypothetical protein
MKRAFKKENEDAEGSKPFFRTMVAKQAFPCWHSVKRGF